MTTMACESKTDGSTTQGSPGEGVPGTGPLRKLDTSHYVDHSALWDVVAATLMRDMGFVESQAKELCKELFRGLVCKSYGKDLNAMAFPAMINITWNVARLTDGYREMCLAVFGYVIESSTLHSVDRTVEIGATKEKYKELFIGEEPGLVWNHNNGQSLLKRPRDRDGVVVASGSKAPKSAVSASLSASKTLNRLTLMSDDVQVVYFETAEHSKAVECIMSSTTKIGEFFNLIEQHVGIKDARYMTAYEYPVTASDTCESLGLYDRDTVTLHPKN